MEKFKTKETKEFLLQVYTVDKLHFIRQGKKNQDKDTQGCCQKLAAFARAS